MRAITEVRMCAAIVLFSVAAGVSHAGRIPPDCYLDQRNGETNSCKYCHTKDATGGSRNDEINQRSYPSLENTYLNVLSPSRVDTLVPPETIPANLGEFLARDNYREALLARGGTSEPGSGIGIYRNFPDLDPDQVGTYNRIGAESFANNGWRAFKWKPYELAWPTNIGRIQLNFIRMADKFQRNARGQLDLDIYKGNLDLLEKVVKGEISTGKYLGMAQDESVVSFRFPAGTELAHYLYYLDPSRPGMKATRIKEVRWDIKSVPEAAISPLYDQPSETDFTLVSRQGGRDAAAKYGLIYNSVGWDIISFIEDKNGDLRPQNLDELTFCIGCHSRRVGVTIDSHFDFQRKLPGDAGWAIQDYRGIPDYYNRKLGRGETAEIFENYFGGSSSVPGNADGTIDFLPTPARADALTRRYYQIVETQSYIFGRDPKIVNPGFFQFAPPGKFLAEDQVDAWDPALDFTSFQPAAMITAVPGEEGQAGTASEDLSFVQFRPNPFNSATTIRYRLPGRGRVELALYSVTGLRVCTLVAAVQAAGACEVHWDGRDAQGRDVPSGAYFCRLQQADLKAVSKLAIVR